MKKKLSTLAVSLVAVGVMGLGMSAYAQESQTSVGKASASEVSSPVVNLRQVGLHDMVILSNDMQFPFGVLLKRPDTLLRELDMQKSSEINSKFQGIHAGPSGVRLDQIVVAISGEPNPIKLAEFVRNNPNVNFVKEFKEGKIKFFVNQAAEAAPAETK